MNSIEVSSDNLTSVIVISRSRTASRNTLFSSARISKTLNVDRVRPPNDDSQDVTQFGSPGDDLQAFIDESDLMISNQDVIL